MGVAAGTKGLSRHVGTPSQACLSPTQPAGSVAAEDGDLIGIEDPAGDVQLPEGGGNSETGRPSASGRLSMRTSQVGEAADDVNGHRVKPQLEVQVLKGPGVVSERGDIANGRQDDLETVQRRDVSQEVEGGVLDVGDEQPRRRPVAELWPRRLPRRPDSPGLEPDPASRLYAPVVPRYLNTADDPVTQAPAHRFVGTEVVAQDHRSAATVRGSASVGWKRADGRVAARSYPLRCPYACPGTCSHVPPTWRNW